MAYIHPKGSPSSLVWVLVDRPLKDDGEKGYLYSAAMGYVWDKIMREAGLPDYYMTCFRPDTENLDSWKNVAGELNQYKPPIIIPLDHIGQKLCRELETRNRGKKYQSESESMIEKYAGSLMTSPQLTYPHWIIPTFGPQRIIQQWKIKDIVASIDLGKAACELAYFKTHGTLEQGTIRKLDIDFDDFDKLLVTLDAFFSYPILSNDIETIYPKPPTKTLPSQFYKILPGYPITIGLAPRTDYGISFSLFRDSTVETRELWKKLAKLLWEVPSLGQNFFNFDANFYEALGFRLPLDKCRDTMIYHHRLWAELPHKLEFLTRQYTREPYYKDEGHNWSLKDMRKLKTYNCKDVCVTLEAYYAMQEELKQRGLE